jgi:hypothetical protein
MHATKTMTQKDLIMPSFPTLTLAVLVLGALPLHCIGNPISEHNMAEVALVSGTLTPSRFEEPDRVLRRLVRLQVLCLPEIGEESLAPHLF